MRRRVAITGLGLVSCLGSDYSTVVGALWSGKSGIRAMPEWAGYAIKSRVAGTIPDLGEKKAAARLPRKLTPAMSDAALFCSLAAKDAVAQAGLSEDLVRDSRTGCIVGSGVGSVDSIYRSAQTYFAGSSRGDPFTVLRSMSSSPSSAVSNLLGIRGRSYSIASACSTSAHNIGHAVELIRGGLLDRAVAGGGEDISELIAASFSALRAALSTKYNDTPEKASRPYDTGRDGFVLSGGGGILVLEEWEQARARGATILAEIIGYAANSDAHDLVLPEPEGRQASACMCESIADAGLTPGDVDYVNTHGTSTILGDVTEVLALRRTFGDAVPAFSSTKSMTGHGIGAAGALETIFCVAMLREGFLAPSINVEDPDPAVADLPLVRETIERRIRVAMTNSFGFGGTNACLVLRRVDE